MKTTREVKVENLLKRLIYKGFVLNAEIRKNAFRGAYLKRNNAINANQKGYQEKKMTKEQKEYVLKVIKRARKILKRAMWWNGEFIFGFEITIPENTKIQWERATECLWVKVTDLTKNQLKRIESLLIEEPN